MIRKQAGDTIVEVLIAMAVASTVLGGAYTVVNRTLANTRQAQEHGEALKIAQSQVEAMKSLYTNPIERNKLNAGKTCVSNSNTVLTYSDAACKKGTADGASDVGYLASITRLPDGLNQTPGSFEVKITWFGVTGKTDTVSQTYTVVEP